MYTQGDPVNMSELENQKMYPTGEAIAMDSVDIWSVMLTGYATAFILGTGCGGLLVVGAGLVIAALAYTVRKRIDQAYNNSH